MEEFLVFISGFNLNLNEYMISSLQLPTYPQELETWWWQKALTKWCDHGEEKILNLLRREIVEQSDRFNKKKNF